MRRHTITTAVATTLTAFALSVMCGASAFAADTTAAPSPEVPWTAPTPKGALTVVVTVADEVPWT